MDHNVAYLPNLKSVVLPVLELTGGLRVAKNLGRSLAMPTLYPVPPPQKKSCMPIILTVI